MDLKGDVDFTTIKTEDFFQKEKKDDLFISIWKEDFTEEKKKQEISYTGSLSQIATTAVANLKPGVKCLLLGLPHMCRLPKTWVYNTPLLPMHCSIRGKKNRFRSTLWTKWIYRTITPQLQNMHSFPAAHKGFCMKDHILDHKANLNISK